MALAPRLELRQSQQLVMTPQLQQAIKLLQLSNLELTEFVEQQLEENPFLERTSDQDEFTTDRRTSDEKVAKADTDDKAPPQEESLDLTRDDATAIAEEALDTSYVERDGGTADGEAAHTGPEGINDWSNVGSGRGGFEDGREITDTHTSEITLREHLNEQLQVATSSAQELFIGNYIIDLIDDAGYLRETTADIATRLGADELLVEQVISILHTFEPAGVGARDLKECLRLQLGDQNRLDPAMAAFVENLELLAKGDLKGLIKATGASEEDVRDMIAEVRSLNPKPGYAYGSDPVQIVAPDIFVKKAADGAWKIELNNDTLPRVLVNQHYYTEVAKTKTPEKDAIFLQEQFSNASWLVKSLDQRARTILKVAGEIVRQQDAFLVHGITYLRPLNLRAVADAIEMHESTVSRVTSNKYVATPRGVFELKYFFTASIASNCGGEAHSAEAIRHRIRELITSETPKSVLSDDKIVELLRAEGVDIARRTVAKYRESMSIPSSVQRRRAAARAAI